jgi:DNA-directed RNA polymerase subunit RPC12/RpoP
MFDSFDDPSDDYSAEPNDEASYVCQSCGEEIVVPVDEHAGDEQEYVEDCPVCCHPHVLRVRLDREYGPSIDARAE